MWQIGVRVCACVRVCVCLSHHCCRLANKIETINRMQAWVCVGIIPSKKCFSLGDTGPNVPWALRIRIRDGTVIDAVVFAVLNLESVQCKRRRQYLLYSIARRKRLRSADCHQLFVPRHRRSMFGRRAFSVAGPAAWNSLPDYLRDPSRSADSFRRDLKTSFLVLPAYTVHPSLCDYALYKSTI